MPLEYLPWYQTGANFLRCSECAALVISGDTEIHTKWHERHVFSATEEI